MKELNNADEGVRRAFSAFAPRNDRRILLVFPRYSHSFGTFNHTFPLLGVRAFMPPQGILLVAALLPEKWEIRFVDENIRSASAEELAWADAVFISGMHIQRGQICDIHRRARQAGKLTVLGGASVSAAPEFYPEIDLLHCGEAGDGTLKLFEHLDATRERPGQQIVFRTTDRLPMSELPSPAYHLVALGDYLLGSVQFSSGCPFTCEFCDIPGLYGRNPRYKTPEQIVNELEQLRRGGVNSVYFVDDNFIANPKAALELLPHLVEWQRRHDFQVRLSCEATLNISCHPKLLEQMREALFTTVFCGIETPEPEALRAMNKSQNLRSPILESIERLNRYGLEVASGIILGLDTDTPETGKAITDFARQSQVPIMTVNILYALPHTPLYERLARAGRLLEDEGRDSNIEFLEPYETVVARWRGVVGEIYEPAAIYGRFLTQLETTYSRRVSARRPWKQLTWRNLGRLVRVMSRLIWRVGIRSDYRGHFWRLCARQMRRGELEALIHVSMVAHHLITYARECTRGRMQSSNYSMRDIEATSLENAPGTSRPQ